MTDLQSETIALPSTFKVRCRVNGQLQGFECQAFTYEEAQAIVKRDLPEARAVLVLIN